jgi:hypothetical protein
MQRSINAMPDQLRHHVAQERGVLLGIHLSRSHREFAMADPPLARDMPCYRHVVGRVGEDRLRHRAVHQPPIGRPVERIAAEDPVPIQAPQIAGLGDRRFLREARQFVGLIRFGLPQRRPDPLNPQIDLGHRETGRFEAKVEVDRREVSKPFAEQPIIPTGKLSQSIVRDRVRLCLFRAQALDPDYRGLGAP